MAMFKHKKNSSILSLLILTAIVFAMVALGGELWHERIHQHVSQASHDECPFFILQMQLFLTALGIGAVIGFGWVLIILRSQPSIVRASFQNPASRVPPSVS